ncbi:PTS lactose/cellobiose transporter subunit IIA [Salipaludibacillus sp. LMS25]|jgi:PTS system cellobiose-specific IIA component|uniref:PTS lactose/cellobiose transporter subunit IIA n=1 Tax=Salipaludibacillus sp. LMS25 TaxID=2924031 RepID=UPI0020D1D00F|nr:PTS lactose/cellobiose transporter subunit IIA [Salipaludibacillus sp. LMS25]UTR13730.1 PTS lactose/cellobiose transporter subunit IIA [Salipaludibacillus sp. LMS25]
MASINNQKENEDQLVAIAMQIILHSGEARSLADRAFSNAKEKNFIKANELLEKANSELLKAHRSQTEVIQNEARGIKYDSSLLFIHAQDHLMTIMSEIKITQKMIELIKLND